jgi:hypothetical protein
MISITSIGGQRQTDRGCIFAFPAAAISLIAYDELERLRFEKASFQRQRLALTSGANQFTRPGQLESQKMIAGILRQKAILLMNCAMQAPTLDVKERAWC